eukprot:SAG31_NODE_40127_length_283_cov_0.635870_1_plen_67_part_10
MVTGAKAELLLADAGDLILWDGRTVHGGRVGHGRKYDNIKQLLELARLSVAVAMVPRAWADEQVLAA